MFFLQNSMEILNINLINLKMYYLLRNLIISIYDQDVPKGCVILALKIAEIWKQNEKIARRKAKLQKIIKTFL